MALPVISGNECTSKISVRQFPDFQIPPIASPNKLNRVWSTVCGGFLNAESRVKQCASLPCKNKPPSIQLPSIFQGNAHKILNEERSLKETVAGKSNIELLELSANNKDCFNLNVDSREKSTTKSNKRQRTHVSRNKFRTIAVSWCGRNPRACYTRRELSDIFAAFGPIKNVRFLSPRFVEIEFVWLGSACLAVRAPKVQLPGKVILHRQWADMSMQRQLWCKKDSRPK